MKNFKKVLALVLTVAMVLSSMTFAFAQTVVQNQEKAEVLFDLGLFKGANPDKFEPRLENDMNRAEAVTMVIRLLGWDTDATAEIPFKDKELSGDYAWAKPFIAKAYEEGITIGNSATEFGVVEKVTLQQYATFLLRALGYEITAENYAQAPEMAYEAGLLSLADVLAADKAAIRDQLVGVSYNALFASEKDSDVTLLEKLIADEKVTEDQVIKSGDADLIALLEEVTTGEDLAIASVVADNLKEVYVTFNKAVDADTVTDANVKVKDNKGSVALKEDGVTAVITLDGNLGNQKEYTLIVENVKDAEGNTMAKTEEKFKAFDATLPEVLDVAVTGPRQVVLTFSEPIAKAGTVEVKQDKANLGSRATVEGNKATVNVYSNFVEDKEYTVKVTGFEDYAEYKNIVNTLSFVYAKDTNPPVATVVKAEQEYVVVEFDKPVKGLTADKFYHTFNAWKAQGIYPKAKADGVSTVKTTDSVTKVFVYFYQDTDGKAIPAGGTNLGILGKEIKDNWGNALGNQEFMISVAADKTAPEVKEIKVEAANKLKVIFTKSVTFKKDNIEVLDENGKKISGLLISKIDNEVGKEFIVTLNKELAGKTVTVSIKDVKDTTVNKNELSLHSELVEITDKSKPKVEEVYYNLERKKEKDFSKKDLFVRFNKDVDSETALVASNYLIVVGEEATILTEAPSYDNVSSRVRIPLTNDQAETLYQAIEKAKSPKLQVINVKDLLGNTITPQTKAISTKVSSTNEVKVEKAVATSTRDLKIKFNDLLSGLTEKNFKIKVGVNDIDVFDFTDKEESGVTVVEFKLPKDDKFATDAKNVEITMDKLDEITNSFGVKGITLKDGNVITFKDEVAPEVTEVKATISKADSEKDSKDKVDVTLTIKFSEKMDEATFSSKSFVVAGGTIEDRPVFDDAKEVATFVVKGELGDIGEVITVSYGETGVTDDAGNKLVMEKSVEAKVKVVE